MPWRRARARRLEQELGSELPFERHIATMLTMIEVDPEARSGSSGST
jgi:hypothetical protein